MGAEDQCAREVERGQVNASKNQEDEVKVPSDDEIAAKAIALKDVSLERFDEADVGGVCWRGNGLWTGQEDANDNLVLVVQNPDQLMDVAVTCVVPVIEGSTTEVLVSNGHPRKVRLLSNIISSLQTSEEKRKVAKVIQRKGRGCSRTYAVSTSERGHVKLMESEWRRISEEVSMPVSILEKLRRLKGFLKVWNRESFGSVDLQIEVTTDLLNDLEGRVE
ncbi:hypothetical protein V6N12_070032 [Hibiscus sabdariffa]|uniref:Uncharacterized protein n=1 Tax=Hibiscus sabdariffa TaxID=183260 RepID=A0ABR2FFM2_9ROSI